MAKNKDNKAKKIFTKAVKSNSPKRAAKTVQKKKPTKKRK